MKSSEHHDLQDDLVTATATRISSGTLPKQLLPLRSSIDVVYLIGNLLLSCRIIHVLVLVLYEVDYPSRRGKGSSRPGFDVCEDDNMLLTHAGPGRVVEGASRRGS